MSSTPDVPEGEPDAGVPPYGPPPGAYGAPPPGVYGYGSPGGYPGGPPAPTGPKPPWYLTLWAGLLAGLVALIIGVVLMFTTASLLPGAIGLLWPFIAIPVIAGGLMFAPKLRRFATGVLIMSAAMWITIIGPCLAILSSF